MNIRTTIAALSLLTLFSFSAAAAQLITDTAAKNLQPVSTVTISGVAGAPMDYREQLSQKADAQGASAFKVIEARTGDNYHITAQLYK